MAQTDSTAKKSLAAAESRGNFRQFFAQLMQVCFDLQQLAAPPMQTRTRGEKMHFGDAFVNRQQSHSLTLSLDASKQCASSY